MDCSYRSWAYSSLLYNEIQKILKIGGYTNVTIFFLYTYILFIYI